MFSSLSTCRQRSWVLLLSESQYFLLEAWTHQLGGISEPSLTTASDVWLESHIPCLVPTNPKTCKQAKYLAFNMASQSIWGIRSWLTFSLSFLEKKNKLWALPTNPSKPGYMIFKARNPHQEMGAISTGNFFLSESTQFLSSKSKAQVRHRMLCLHVRLCHYRKLCQMQGNQFSWSGLEWHWADGLNQHNWVKHNKLNTTKCSFSPWNFPRCAREIYYHSVLPENEIEASVRTLVEGCHFFSRGAQ